MMAASLPVLASRSILSSLPSVSAAFAYGSAAFKQANNYSRDNMLDLILVVDNPKEFHSENLQRNPHHYSFVRVFGPAFISRLNDAPAYVYYNTAVRIDEQLLKYGVISKDRLISDLLDWDVLYTAGRMHKPINYITDVDTEMSMAQDMNLRSALHTALLTLPETFSLQDLFIRITRLSYDGDFRMLFGEDKNKVANIVKPAMREFEDIYSPFLTSMTTVEWSPGSSQVHQDLSQAARLHHLELLPKSVQHQLLTKWRPGDNRHKDVEDVLKSIARNPSSLCADIVHRSVRSIVRGPALGQSLKGLLTSGPIIATEYVMKKIGKMISSQRRKS
ncbi:phosphatidate cytidylyltransferase, mitochondrial [Galendromus occidentalis]|uniref:Phosphatidate cytidylyltransferase, mitochondrial n=1 Tax=Galendromus occidentalis TaxID=34638 RepID=A0AAJ6VYY3_9ACAR|nr:phosphatidate cytidylyltransferase, mitochondrial [Galendromus occidentalis]